MKGKEKKIVVNLPMRGNVVIRIADGIMHYAKTRTNWEIQFQGFHPANENLQYFDSWHPDGLIAQAPMSENDPLLRNSSLKAIVFIDRPAPKHVTRQHAISISGNSEIGTMAAEFFLKQDLDSYAFVGSLDGKPWSEERWTAYKETLNAAGKSPVKYKQSNSPIKWTTEATNLMTFLRSLPGRCGVFAAFDQRAKHVLDACHEGAISVPEKVQVLGVDNEEWVCENTTPTLSSIDPDFHAAGYYAAERLDAMLRGKGFKDILVPIPPRCIIERGSTRNLIGPARIVSAAQDFIRRNAIEDITVRDIARASDTSLRLLQRYFSQYTGSGIYQTLREQRLKKACKLLTQTNTNISVITDRCRLGGEFNAKTLFRKKFGMTMSEWRKANKHKT